MGLFNKKDPITLARREEEDRRMQKALESARNVSRMLNELKLGCETEDELKERLVMLKEMNPDVFHRFREDLTLTQANAKFEHGKKIIDWVKTIDDKDLEKMERLDTLGKKSKTLKFLESK